MTELLPRRSNPGGAGSPGGSSPVVRAFPFTFDAANLVTGHTLYTPTVGDILLDAWVEVTTAWDGTTPFGDFGTFAGTGTTTGVMQATADDPIDMTEADREATGDGGSGLGLLYGNSANSLAIMNALYAVHSLAQVDADGTHLDMVPANGGNGLRTLPLKFSATNPIKFCVSQTGKTDGADPGSTQGAAILYLVTATPASA